METLSATEHQLPYFRFLPGIVYLGKALIVCSRLLYPTSQCEKHETKTTRPNGRIRLRSDGLVDTNRHPTHLPSTTRTCTVLRQHSPDLPSAWLVVLSACETALVNPAELADEHFGLALGPLYAGAPTVWGTLWAVGDVATGLLMGKAYDLLQAGRSKAALREAQLWLRELTAGEVAQILKAHAAGQPTRMLAKVAAIVRMALSHLLPVQREYALMDASERPFAHPYYWSAFQCVGV
jgi:CHAT domain-containing protein